VEDEIKEESEENEPKSGSKSGSESGSEKTDRHFVSVNYRTNNTERYVASDEAYEQRLKNLYRKLH